MPKLEPGARSNCARVPAGVVRTASVGPVGSTVSIVHRLPSGPTAMSFTNWLTGAMNSVSAPLVVILATRSGNFWVSRDSVSHSAPPGPETIRRGRRSGPEL